MNQLKKKSPKPCTDCPEEKTIEFNLAPPLEYQWSSLDNAGKTTYQAAHTTEEVQIKDIDLTDLKRFSLRDQHGKDKFGIDVEHRAFMIMSVDFFTDLPEGKYTVFFTRRNRHYSDGRFMRWYILGIKGEVEERYLYINPDNTFKMTNKFI